MVLTLLNGSSTQKVCFTKTMIVSKYNYWFEHWNLNCEECKKFYLTQMGIGNGSEIEIDNLYEEVFSEDFLKKKFVTEEPSPTSSSDRGKLKLKTDAGMVGIL